MSKAAHNFLQPKFGRLKFQGSMDFFRDLFTLKQCFFLSGRNLHLGPMHDTKIWKECHLLAPIVGFFTQKKHCP
jgi:hypothetical protein